MAIQLRGIDAAFVALDSPTGHLHGLGVVRLRPGTQPLTLDDLIALVRARLPKLDLLRRKLVTVPFRVDRPYWIDVQPDLAEHIRSHRLPAADGTAAFERFCAEVAGTPMDRSKPMWEFWLVDGLPSAPASPQTIRSSLEGQALVIKMHHSLCDGVGSLAFISQLFDVEPANADPTSEEPGRAAAPPPPDEGPPVLPLVLGRAAVHAVRRPFEVASTALDLAGAARRLRRTIESFEGEPIAVPLATPHLSFDGPVSADRVVALRELPFGRVKAIADASGTKVNDVILAVLAGTIRRWLEASGQVPDQPLVAAVPVSTRSADQLFEPGNYVSACFVHLPVDQADPAACLRIAARVAASGKAMHRAVGSDVLERLVALPTPLLLSLPAAIYQRGHLAAHHPAPVNLVVSNVAGPPIDLSLLGRPLDAFYALGPIFDSVTLNITAISFHDVLAFGYVACPDQLDDLTALADQQEASFEALATSFNA
jgi:diacylglycerol O-acyltransferase